MTNINDPLNAPQWPENLWEFSNIKSMIKIWDYIYVNSPDY